MTLSPEEGRRELRYAARRFAKAKAKDFPLRIVLKRYHALYDAMHLARMAGVRWDRINETIRREDG